MVEREGYLILKKKGGSKYFVSFRSNITQREAGFRVRQADWGERFCSGYFEYKDGKQYEEVVQEINSFVEELNESADLTSSDLKKRLEGLLGESDPDRI